MTNNFCRVSGTRLTKVLNFGMQPLGNGFIVAKDFKDEYFFPMEIGYSEVSMMFQLIKQPVPEKMFHDHYAFYSSTSSFMDQHFKQYVQMSLLAPNCYSRPGHGRRKTTTEGVCGDLC